MNTKPVELRKTAELHVGFTPAAYQRIQALAERADVSVSEIVRRAVEEFLMKCGA